MNGSSKGADSGAGIAVGRLSPAAAPDVSIIIASYNCAAFLEHAIRSGLNQVGVSVEVVVVDDCSTDDSFEVAQLLAKADSRLRVSRAAQNGGPAAARNLAVAQTSGRWIAVLDSDDLMHPSRLKALIDEAERANVDIIADDLSIFRENANVEIGRLLPRHCRGAFNVSPRNFIESNCMYGRSAPLGYLKPIFRASAWKKYDLSYDANLRIGEDYDLLARALIRGLIFRVLPLPTYHYRKHEASISYRIRRTHIEALIRSDEELRQAERIEEKALEGALDRRRRSLQTAAGFDDLVDAIKRLSIRDILSAAAKSPAAILLLRMPLYSAWRRCVASVGRWEYLRKAE